jgi:hypothetical protein
VERSGRSAHSEDAAIPGLEVSLWERGARTGESEPGVEACQG